MSEPEGRFIEHLSILLEGLGESRMAGRIFAALLLSDSSETSSSELARTLGISHGSVSMATRDLLAHGFIERVGVPGERQAYFRIKSDPDVLVQFIIEAGKQMREIEELLARGEQVVKNKDQAVLERLEGLREMFEFFRREMDLLLMRWGEHKKGG